MFNKHLPFLGGGGGMYAILKIASNIVNKFSKIFVTANLLIIVLVIMLQVISRYLFNAPFSWTMEANIFLFEWMIFIGASIVLKEKDHVKMDFFVAKLSVKARSIIELVVFMILLVFLIILVRNNIKILPMHSEYKTPVLRIPTSFFNISFTLGSVFMIVHFLERVFGLVRDIMRGEIK